jgi:hypothetical protein
MRDDAKTEAEHEALARHASDVPNNDHDNGSNNESNRATENDSSEAKSATAGNFLIPLRLAHSRQIQVESPR